MSPKEELSFLRNRVIKLEKALTEAHKALHNEGTNTAFTISSIHGFLYKGPTFTRSQYQEAMQR